MRLEHPSITRSECDGGGTDVKVIGCCLVCRNTINKGEEAYKDKDEHLFCSKDCACEFNGIEEIDNDE